ncbi:YeeE/YedE family protein [Acuticoccus sp. MNP-M23]|uniref:YeeE/YedE family protein n=1 Tax=Acuticoccus sp. MNP-M23 TaxID=3072793 RepID=UPI00281540D5|nr:YeeE/YedE family protein [Acuticoccus sp. MNP-M23]WMS42716.1 YeeE/YedE family protein [Acuticoccus sp. MNP-M23]
MTADYFYGLLGGLLIGASASVLLVFNGRVAGISGIFGRLIGSARSLENAAFIAGLLAGPALYLLAFGGWPQISIAASWPVLVLAGLLVGFGTRLGSGCTSGHGVVGLARLSRRSMVATAVFLTVGVVTASLMGALA